MSTNNELRDAAIRHAIYLNRYGNGLAGKIVDILNTADRELKAKLGAALVGSLSERRLTDLLAELRIVNDKVYAKAFASLAGELIDLTSIVADAEVSTLTRAVPLRSFKANLPAPARLAALVRTSPIDGFLLDSWRDNMSANRLGRVEQAIRQSTVQGETVDQSVRRIIGTKAAGYRDGVLDISRRSAKSLVLTANATVAANAREETYKANSDIIRGVQWLSTLDSRTSPICQSRDGEFYELDKPHPKTPAHIRCRSVLIPVTKKFSELGIDREEITAETRASMDGQLPAKQTYGQWLKNQSEARQDDILGKQRADLFRSGNLPFKEMYRDDGSFRSISELRAAMGGKAPTPTAPTAPVAPTPPVAPVRPQPTAIEPVTRAQANKRMTARLNANAADPRYSPTPEFRGVKATQFGKSNLSAEFTDDAASMINAISTDLDRMADQFSVPRLRGYRTLPKNSKNVGSMGDGMMNLNPAYFNRYAATVGGKSPVEFTERLETQRATLRSQLDTVKAELAALRTKRLALPDGPNNPEWIEIALREKTLVTQFNELVKPFNDLNKKVGAAQTGTVSTYKIGDELKTRPFGVSSYFTEIDEARAILYHEFGHHIHQMYRKTGPRRLGLPPLEIELERLYRSKTRVERDAGLPSRYAGTNSKEWFAENFAAFMLGREDLVDDDLIALIRRLIDENK